VKYSRYQETGTDQFNSFFFEIMGIHLVWKRMNVCEKYRLDSLEIGKIPSMKKSAINQSSNDQAVARNTATQHME